MSTALLQVTTFDDLAAEYAPTAFVLVPGCPRWPTYLECPECGEALGEDAAFHTAWISEAIGDALEDLLSQHAEERRSCGRELYAEA
ncbi:hypothetical protein NE857_09375 [Nocardiopsis exhalans]|uniref:Uncharacterized protein n=1 Tax=Nocardiopsis exhalans TaxID=163604 RepID=A0ABY5DFB6_9ACTN|nr:hypothetical protein [Nocardiopsis exhalans]USY21792.1 hypothetical protein NE857_09375 [Nocardiopsis exhalans]